MMNDDCYVEQISEQWWIVTEYIYSSRLMYFTEMLEINFQYFLHIDKCPL